MIKTLMPGKPVDVLGNGFALAPPSRTAKGTYQFLSGSLDDLASLPVMKLGGQKSNRLPELPRSVSAPIALIGERNNTLFRLAMQAAPQCATIEDLERRVAGLNEVSFAEPLPASEVLRVVGNVWSKTQAGENWFHGPQRMVISHDEHDALQELGPDAFALAMRLRREHWGRDSFFVADAMAEAMPGGAWARKRFSSARNVLLTAGVIVKTRAAATGRPALFRFGGNAHAGRRGERGGGV